MASVVLKGVSKYYSRKVVGLHPTDLSIESGEHVVLLGPSGSGKSTLLRLVAGLERGDTGQILIDGRRIDRVPPHRRGIAFLTQRPALYPHLTVSENINISELKEKNGVVGEAIELLELGGVLSRYPHQLSGGQRQRAALGKLLARQARVWLLDEPFGTLDPVFRSEFRQNLHLLIERSRATMIMVTHDPIDASALGRRIGVLVDGRLQQFGTPDLLRDRPGNRFAAFSLGRFSLVDGTMCEGELGHWFTTKRSELKIPVPKAVVDSVRKTPSNGVGLTVGIRPEDIVSSHREAKREDSTKDDSKPDSIVRLVGWRVAAVEPLGSRWSVTLIHERTLLRTEYAVAPEIGEFVDREFSTDRCRWFEGETGRRIGD